MLRYCTNCKGDVEPMTGPVTPDPDNPKVGLQFEVCPHCEGVL